MISSISGIRGLENRIVYGSTKGALEQLTRFLALEFGPHQVAMPIFCSSSSSIYTIQCLYYTHSSNQESRAFVSCIHCYVYSWKCDKGFRGRVRYTLFVLS